MSAAASAAVAGVVERHPGPRRQVVERAQERDGAEVDGDGGSLLERLAGVVAALPPGPGVRSGLEVRLDLVAEHPRRLERASHGAPPASGLGPRGRIVVAVDPGDEGLRGCEVRFRLKPRSAPRVERRTSPRFA